MGRWYNLNLDTRGLAVCIDSNWPIFRKKYNWKHYLLRDDGNVFKVLKIDKKSKLTVMNPTGEIIFNITDIDNKSENGKLLDVLNQELENLKQ